MLLQGLTAGIGLLMILPLLQLVGIEMASTLDARLTDSISVFFTNTGIPLTLESILVIYIIIIAITATTRYQLSVMSSTLQQNYICSLRSNLYKDLLLSRWQFIIAHKMSDFIHSLSTQVQGIGIAAHQMLTLLSQVVLMGVMIALAFLLSWKMSLVAAIFSLVLLILLIPLNSRIHRSGKTQLFNHKLIFQLITEQLSSLKMIKSYGSEAHYAQELQQVSETLEQQAIRFTRFNALSQWLLLVGGAIAFTLFFYLSQRLFEIELPTLFLLLIIFSRLLPQITGVQRTWQQLLHRLPSFKDIEQMTVQCQSAKESNALLSADAASPTLQKSLRLENIHYRYPNKNQSILHSFSATLPYNHSIALVGPSGSGKTTLADLIAGLLEPNSGQIICDDIPLEGMQRIAWRRSIAYVTQEVYLFHDTIRANLNWVSPNITDEDIWQALELAAAHDFVSALEQQLDTVIGDRGIRLSGGERQRLALARALLSKPQLLILDEATSALDNANERKIQQALKQLHGKLTILIIAHRETTIEHVDQVITLKPMAED